MVDVGIQAATACPPCYAFTCTRPSLLGSAVPAAPGSARLVRRDALAACCHHEWRPPCCRRKRLELPARHDGRAHAQSLVVSDDAQEGGEPTAARAVRPQTR